MKRLIPLILLFMLSRSLHLFGQQDTVQLNTAVIFSDRKWLFASGSFTETVDSTVRNLFQGQPLDEWPLSSSLHLKNYGPGGITTASARGLEARHTSVIWNGIPVNSPSLGLTDLALLTPVPNAEVTFFHGNASALYHTTASGSALILDEKNHFEKQISGNASVESGSFKNRKYMAGMQFSGSTFYQSVFMKLHQSENDFPFVNTAMPYSPEQIQQHAQEKQFILSSRSAFKITAKDELTFSCQFMKARREIPPLMTQSISSAVLEDSLLHALLHFKKIIHPEFSVQFKAAVLTDGQRFTDTLSRIFSENKRLTYYYDVSATYAFNHLLTARGGLVYSNTRFDFTDYENSKHLEDYSAFSSLRFEKKKFIAAIHFRKTQRKNQSSPVMASAGAEFHASEYLHLRVQASNSFQFPTGNDLFWKPGGNPDLKPEHCLSGEAGADIRFRKLFQYSFTFYRNEVSDWIQWVPGASGFYSPLNVKKIRAQGFESTLTLPLAFHPSIKVKLTGTYTFSQSVNRALYQALADDILNKQLIYIPKHAAGGSLDFSFRKLFFRMDYHFNGVRYTTADHSYFLPSHHLIQCAWMYSFQLKKLQLSPSFRISNLTDEQYQSVAWRPMPGRSFTVGLNITFQHKPINT